MMNSKWLSKLKVRSCCVTDVLSTKLTIFPDHKTLSSVKLVWLPTVGENSLNTPPLVQ